MRAMRIPSVVAVVLLAGVTPSYAEKNSFPTPEAAAHAAIRKARTAHGSGVGAGWIYVHPDGTYGHTPPGNIGPFTGTAGGGPDNFDRGAFNLGGDAQLPSGEEIVGRFQFDGAPESPRPEDFLRDYLHHHFNVDVLFWNDGELLVREDYGDDPSYLIDTLAGLFGDPHVVTADGLRYDLQAVGEFVAIQSEDASLRIHVRFRGNSSGRVSTMVALAIASGTDRVAYDGEDPEHVLVNGTPVARTDLRTSRTLSGGSRIDAKSALRLVSPRGDVLEIGLASRSALSLVVALSEGRRSSVAGLYGNFDGDPGNDLLPRDVQEPIPPSDRDALYADFAPSWRLTADESLFAYEAGTSTESFTDAAYPRAEGQEATADQWAAARQTLRARGITPRHPFYADILFDMVETGDVSFARAAEEMLEIRAGLGAVRPAPTRLPAVIIEDDPAKNSVRRIDVTFSSPTQRVVIPLRIGPSQGHYVFHRRYIGTEPPPVRWQLLDLEGRPLIRPVQPNTSAHDLERGTYTLLLMPNPQSHEALGPHLVQLHYRTTEPEPDDSR